MAKKAAEKIHHEAESTEAAEMTILWEDRDRCAMAAMNGLLAHGGTPSDVAGLAALAYSIADEMGKKRAGG